MRHTALVLLGLLCLGAHASDAPSSAIDQMPPSPAADAPARLFVSRDNNAPNACDVELYVNQQVVAKLGRDENTSLDIPSGELSLAVAMSPDGYCGGQGPEAAQSILLRPGEIRQFAIVVEEKQVFLAPLD
ncbi:hypothetical protein ACJRW5_24010 [Pseudomonas sp. SH1-B]